MIADLKQLTLFILTGQLILHLLPGDGFDKYIRIQFRIMILSKLLLLLFSVGRMKIETLFMKSVSEYDLQMEEKLTELETEFAEYALYMMDMEKGHDFQEVEQSD